MEERLTYIVNQPRSWMHWEPVAGGLRAQGLIAARYPRATCFVHHENPAQAALFRSVVQQPWWHPGRWTHKAVQFEPPAQPVQMLWANMVLHMAADPQALIKTWHNHIEVDGFLMFSCLGPDSLLQLRQIYARAGWPPPAHQFTDMHDWGDMLAGCGFAEPVMDMERITLTWSSPQLLLQELRGMGRNLHVQRFPGLQGRGHLARLHHALAEELGAGRSDGRLALTFEINYGHAFKPRPKWAVKPETTLSLDEMRRTLQQSRS